MVGIIPLVKGKVSVVTGNLFSATIKLENKPLKLILRLQNNFARTSSEITAIKVFRVWCKYNTVLVSIIL